MKREDLEALGLTKEQVDKVCDLNNADVAPLKKELQKAQDDLKEEKGKREAHEETIKGLKKDLEEFKDADVSGMKQKIADLEADIKQKDEDHQSEIADRDFNDLLKESIAGARGRNAKAITALLDVDVLKTSKNQKEDITAALKTLSEAEDSSMLFGEVDPTVRGAGNIIGTVTKPSGGSDDAQMRAVMGLPPATEGK